jgi:hypothetical protein
MFFIPASAFSAFALSVAGDAIASGDFIGFIGGATGLQAVYVLDNVVTMTSDYTLGASS